MKEIKVSFSEYLESLNPKKRKLFLAPILKECDITPASISNWKKTNKIPKYAIAAIQKLAPDVHFDFITSK